MMEACPGDRVATRWGYTGTVVSVDNATAQIELDGEHGGGKHWVNVADITPLTTWRTDADNQQA